MFLVQPEVDGFAEIGLNFLHHLTLRHATGQHRHLGPEPAFLRNMDNGFDIHARRIREGRALFNVRDAALLPPSLRQYFPNPSNRSPNGVFLLL